MAKDDDERRSHVVRIYKDDDKDSDSWIDVERIDHLVFEMNAGPLYIKQFFNFDWKSFDPKDTKTTQKKKVFAPGSDPKDKDADFVEVPIRRAIGMEANTGFEYQKSTYKLKNNSGEDQVNRKIKVRKVGHFDVDSIDNKGQPPSKPQDYVDAINKESKDEDNALEVEVIVSFYTEHGKGYTFKRHIWNLHSEEDITLIFDGNVKKWVKSSGDGDIDPPWRLDPLQNIVNHNFGGLAVIFGEKDKDAPPQKKKGTP